MRRLRKTDGTFLHRRAARYHITQCRIANTPFHIALADQMQARYGELVTHSRAVEDARDDRVDASALVDAAEIGLENAIRDADAALACLDRKNPLLNARRTVFPKGFTPIIAPEGMAQLGTLPEVRVGLARFADQPGVADRIAEIHEAETRFRAALTIEEKAKAEVERLHLAEQVSRCAVREQFEVAYGRLREFHKSRPQQAEQFFLREQRLRREKEDQEGKEDTGTAASRAE